MGNESYGDKIAKLIDDPKYIHNSGKHKGEVNKTKIAKKVGCSEASVRYHLDEKVKKNVIYRADKHRENKKTIGFAYDKNKRKGSKDPESLFNPSFYPEMLLRICDDDIVNQRIREMQY